MATVAALLTAEEFATLPDEGRQTELVRGRIIELPPTEFWHGLVCAEMIFLLSTATERLGSGRVIGNDSGVITQRNPDSVRGPDVAFYGANKVPPVEQWKGYPALPPDLVVEVRSPSDRWSKLVQKAGEYLDAGVLVVVLLDPDTRSAHVFRGDEAPARFGPDDTLTVPDLLGDFAVVVGRIFA